MPRGQPTNPLTHWHLRRLDERSDNKDANVIIDGIEYFPVSDDPAILNMLDEKHGVLGSQELGQFAAQALGLEPPKLHGDGSTPAIVLIWPMEAGHGIWVWDVHEMPEADPDDFNESGSDWSGEGDNFQGDPERQN